MPCVLHYFCNDAHLYLPSHSVNKSEPVEDTQKLIFPYRNRNKDKHNQPCSYGRTFACDDTFVPAVGVFACHSSFVPGTFVRV